MHYLNVFPALAILYGTFFYSCKPLVIVHLSKVVGDEAQQITRILPSSDTQKMTTQSLSIFQEISNQDLNSVFQMNRYMKFIPKTNRQSLYGSLLFKSDQAKIQTTLGTSRIQFQT